MTNDDRIRVAEFPCPYCQLGIAIIWLTPKEAIEFYNVNLYIYRCDICGKKVSGPELFENVDGENRRLVIDRLSGRSNVFSDSTNKTLKDLFGQSVE